VCVHVCEYAACVCVLCALRALVCVFEMCAYFRECELCVTSVCLSACNVCLFTYDTNVCSLAIQKSNDVQRMRRCDECYGQQLTKTDIVIRVN
jgi:hypothetical protein